MTDNKQSCESVHLFIDRDGVWYSNGVRVIHERIFKLFNESLHADGKGGYYIQIGDETCAVEVENTPFVVRGLYFENNANGRDAIRLILNDGRNVELDAETLCLCGGDEIRCLVLSEKMEACFSPTAMSQLSQYLSHDSSNGELILRLNERDYRIGAGGL